MRDCEGNTFKVGDYIKYQSYTDGHLVVGPIFQVESNGGWIYVIADDKLVDSLKIGEVISKLSDEAAMLYKLEQK